MNSDSRTNMSTVRIAVATDIAPSRSALIDSHWIVGAVLVCVAMPLIVFASMFAEMVAIWRRSDIFVHGFLVFPAFAYMVWRQRSELAAHPVRPAPLALFGVFSCGFVVTLGSIAAALTPGFFGLIGASIFTVIAVLGWGLARAIWVPLLFLFFAVPFGEVFVPHMIDWTADFTVAAVAASGVPVFREGPNFVIPSGSWSVVYACSGIRYLLASMFAGWLYAWLMYRSTARRIIFMAVSVLVPIVANWLRAYIIVMLGHLSGNTIATGIDHFVYGWVFFGIVIGLMFLAGSYFREDGEAPAVGRAVKVMFPSRRLLPVAMASLALLSGWQLATMRLADSGDKRAVVAQSVQPANGWTQIGPDFEVWVPQLRRPSATLTQHFEKDGRQVTVHIGLYRNQSQESELVNSLNDLSYLIKSPWRQISTAASSITLGQDRARVNSAFARRGSEALLVWQWYWLDGKVTASEAEAKARLALDRLLGRNDTSAWVAIYGINSGDAEAAREALREFASEMGPAFEAALRETAER